MDAQAVLFVCNKDSFSYDESPPFFIKFTKIKFAFIMASDEAINYYDCKHIIHTYTLYMELHIFKTTCVIY